MASMPQKKHQHRRYLRQLRQGKAKVFAAPTAKKSIPFAKSKGIGISAPTVPTVPAPNKKRVWNSEITIIILYYVGAVEQLEEKKLALTQKASMDTTLEEQAARNRIIFLRTLHGSSLLIIFAQALNFKPLQFFLCQPPTAIPEEGDFSFCCWDRGSSHVPCCAFHYFWCGRTLELVPEYLVQKFPVSTLHKRSSLPEGVIDW